jgi:hypothetical protein
MHHPLAFSTGEIRSFERNYSRTDIFVLQRGENSFLSKSGSQRNEKTNWFDDAALARRKVGKLIHLFLARNPIQVLRSAQLERRKKFDKIEQKWTPISALKPFKSAQSERVG